MMRIFRGKIPLLLTAAVTTLTAAGGEFIAHFPDFLLTGTAQHEQLLQRGKTALLLGDISYADKVFEFFNQKNPLMDITMFSVPLNFVHNEPEKALRSLFKYTQNRPNSDDSECELARCMTGELLLESGNPCAAIYLFQKLAARPKAAAGWRMAARRGEVLAWIRLDGFTQADELLKKIRTEFPQAGNTFYLPELLSLSSSGRSDRLLERWKVMKEVFAPRPEPILYRILTDGAEHARSRREYQTAQELFAAAYNYSSNDDERKDIFRKLLNIQREYAPENALTTIDRFLQFFPDLPERFDLELLRGELSCKLGQFQKALDYFVRMVDDSKIPPNFRIQAAEVAARTAENNKNYALSRRMYESAISLTQDEESKQSLQFELLKFLLRIKEYSAASAFAAGLEPVMGRDNDELNLLYLQALIVQKNFQKGSEVALRLSRSPINASEGIFYLAYIMEQQGKLADARKGYLQYYSRFPRKSHAAEAYLAAAEIALQNKDFQAAKRELKKFPEKFPGHAKAPGALLSAIYVINAQNAMEDDIYEDTGEIEKINGIISVNFPNTPEHDTAALLTAESLYYARRYTPAVALLEEFFRRSPKSPLLPEALLLKARCLTAQKKSQAALDILAEFMKNSPDSPIAADAALEAGRCAARIGDYRLALKYYEKVETFKGSEIVRNSALCEKADCYLMLHKPQELEKALKIYSQVAENPCYPPLQLESAFKRGVVQKLLSRPKAAVNSFERVLKLVHSNRQYLLYPGVPDWCARAAQEALQLMVKANLPNGAQKAKAICDLYEGLSIPGSMQELKKNRSTIYKYYDFHPAKK